MLYEFLKSNRVELIARCRTKAARRAPAGAPAPVNEFGIPQFLTQLIETFRVERTPEALARQKLAGTARPSLALVPTDIASTAAKHGNEMRLQGATIDQVVHGYGDLCQALTELAIEMRAPITVDEFHTFNRCLDDAIADAVTSYTRDGPAIPDTDFPAMNGHPASPAQEMRALVETAIHTFAAIKGGNVGLAGRTSDLHARSLAGLRALVDRVLGDPTRAADEPRARAAGPPAALR